MSFNQMLTIVKFYFIRLEAGNKTCQHAKRPYQDI
jgi:hypothetical protein